MDLSNHTLLYVLFMSYVQLHHVFFHAAFYLMTSKYLTIVVD